MEPALNAEPGSREDLRVLISIYPKINLSTYILFSPDF